MESDNHWHLDKRLNIGHLLTTMTVAAAIIIWGNSVETRLAVLEEQQIHQEKQRAEDMALIRAELSSINRKIDRIIERR